MRRRTRTILAVAAVALLVALLFVIVKSIPAPTKAPPAPPVVPAPPPPPPVQPKRTPPPNPPSITLREYLSRKVPVASQDLSIGISPFASPFECKCPPTETGRPVCARGGLFSTPCAAKCHGAQAEDIGPATAVTYEGVTDFYTCEQRPKLPKMTGKACPLAKGDRCLFGTKLGTDCQVRRRGIDPAATYSVLKTVLTKEFGATRACFPHRA